MNLNDLNPPTKKIFSEFCCNFWTQRTLKHWIAMKWLKINQDNLSMKFSALNVDFSSPSSDPLDSRNYPQKVVVLPQLSRVAWKRFQIGTDMLLTITSNGDKLFIGVNVDDFEWPWTPKIGAFSEFFAISGCDTHFKSELRRNGWRWTWTTCVWHF